MFPFIFRFDPPCVCVCIDQPHLADRFVSIVLHHLYFSPQLWATNWPDDTGTVLFLPYLMRQLVSELWLIIYLCKTNRLASIVSIHTWQRCSTWFASFPSLFPSFSLLLSIHSSFSCGALVQPVTTVPSGGLALVGSMGNCSTGSAFGRLVCHVRTAKCFAISANCSSVCSQLPSLIHWMSTNWVRNEMRF